jgi:hypothetical protein
VDWENESYVRLYVRDTTTWRRMGWNAQCVLMHLLRRVDRSGRLELEGLPPWEIVALHTGAPSDVAKEGIERLLFLEVATLDMDALFLPTFTRAQTAKRADRLRQRESRDRRRTSQDVTDTHDTGSRLVTGGHDESSDVTSDGVASRSVTLSLAKLSSTELSQAVHTNARARGFDDPVPDDSDAPPGFSEPSPRERSKALIADLQGMQLAWSMAVDELKESGALKSAPQLTHTHLKQAAERATGVPGVSRDEAALALARHALRTALERGRLDQVGFLLVTLDPWAPAGAQAGQRGRGTTAADFANEPSADEQRARARANAKKGGQV